jgi:hypothetical protein
MSDRAERRRNHALRRRVDQMVERAHAARAEIVERGLDAVHIERRRGAASAAPATRGPSSTTR